MNIYLDTDELYKAMQFCLNKNGCSCGQPLVGYRPNFGIRCRLCNKIISYEQIGKTLCEELS